MDFGGGDGTGSVVLLFTLSDVTHPEFAGESDGDCQEYVGIYQLLRVCKPSTTLT